jgi:hypothetical protein
MRGNMFGISSVFFDSSEAGKSTPMFRLTVMTILFAVGAAFAAIPQAGAQSPDPALLAPGQSGRMLAPPRYSISRPSYGSARHRNVFTSYRSLNGARLSHPSVHIH